MHVLPIPSGCSSPHVLPLNALTDFEGKDSSAVNFEPGEGKTTASWTDRGMPQLKEYVLGSIELADFPGSPAEMAACTGLIPALADATGSTGTEEIRYALAHAQLRGGTGEIVATDGKQLLLQRGFKFPWKDDVLVPSTAAFRCKELAEATDFTIGKTDTHVALQAGAWTLFLPIKKDGRYPRVDDVVPRESNVTSRCQLDPADAQFLVQALPRLPGRGDENSPITIDLDSQVVVRAKDADSGRITEVLLARSERSGKPVRFVVNRDYIARALALGLHSLEIINGDTPFMCRDGQRTLVVMPLGKKGAIESTGDAIRIISTEVTPATSPRRRMPVSTSTENGDVAINGDGHHDNSSNGAASTAKKTRARREKPTTAKNLVEEAIALRSMLREACGRSNALIAALKKQKRQGRLLRETLASLRQLQQTGTD